MARAYVHDPEANLDYSVDWTDWIGTDTISSVTWTVPTGLTKGIQTKTDTIATVWISGGTAGTSYSVECKITTAGGRTDERTITLRCQER